MLPLRDIVADLPRGARSGERRIIDYRHFIDALKRKPQAFKGLVFRDALFPREAYRRTWEALERRLSQRSACRTMVNLLELAGMEGIEAVLAERLDALCRSDQLPDQASLRDEFAPPATISVLQYASICRQPVPMTRCCASRCSHERAG